MKAIWKPINWTNWMQDTRHPWYGHEITLHDYDPKMESFTISVNDFTGVPDSKNRFHADKCEVEIDGITGFSREEYENFRRNFKKNISKLMTGEMQVCDYPEMWIIKGFIEHKQGRPMVDSVKEIIGGSEWR